MCWRNRLNSHDALGLALMVTQQIKAVEVFQTRSWRPETLDAFRKPFPERCCCVWPRVWTPHKHTIYPQLLQQPRVLFTSVFREKHLIWGIILSQYLNNSRSKLQPHTRIHARMHTHTHRHMHARTHTRTQTHRHARTQKQTHAHTHTHTHARTHAHTHTHTH